MKILNDVDCHVQLLAVEALDWAEAKESIEELLFLVQVLVPRG